MRRARTSNTMPTKCPKLGSEAKTRPRRLARNWRVRTRKHQERCLASYRGRTVGGKIKFTAPRSEVTAAGYDPERVWVIHHLNVLLDTAL